MRFQGCLVGFLGPAGDSVIMIQTCYYDTNMYMKTNHQDVKDYNQVNLKKVMIVL